MIHYKFNLKVYPKVLKYIKRSKIYLKNHEKYTKSKYFFHKNIPQLMLGKLPMKTATGAWGLTRKSEKRHFVFS